MKNVPMEFHADELLAMLQDGRLREMARRGYVAQADADGSGMCRWVHWSQSATAGRQFGEGLNTRRFQLQDDPLERAKANLTPIVRRSPQQRLESLVRRLVDEAKATGTIPGLSDATIREITGEFWKAGQTQVTSEMVHRIARHFLERAEADAKARDFKKVTRHQE